MKLSTAIAAELLIALSPISYAQSAPAPADAPRKAPADAEPDRAKLEEQFEKTMSGATLVGHFTVERPGQNGGKAGEPKEERYTLTKVSKAQGDKWLFMARIQFGGKDVNVPLMIPVKWAGDTPVISVTDMGIPGLGTYTARVMVYGDHYAGTWSGGDHGGHLWGRIEPAADATRAGDKDAAAGDKPSK